MKKYFAFIYCFLLFTQLSFSQEMGALLLKNYNVEEFKADAQNWYVLQDKRGVLFFGNTSRLLEFDGISWNHYFNSNLSIIRSMGIDSSGTIFLGGSAEIGYLEPDQYGKIIYHSLNQYIPKDKQAFQDVWKTYIADNKVYFFTRQNVIIWDYKKITIIDMIPYAFFSFKLHNKNIVVSTKGLSLFKDTTFTILKNTFDIVKGGGIINLLESDSADKIFIISDKKGHLSFVSYHILK